MSSSGEYPKLQSKYSFENVTSYIAKRYGNLQEWQVANRTAALRFMDGKLTEKDMEDIKNTVIKTLNKYRRKKGKWIISYIPASTSKKYTKRYWGLTYYLRKQLDLPVAYFGICLKEENIKNEGADKAVTTDNLYIKWHLFRVRERNVILVDDNITTGKTLRTVGDFLMDKGANFVCGVVFSRTIHPDLPIIENY